MGVICATVGAANLLATPATKGRNNNIKMGDDHNRSKSTTAVITCHCRGRAERKHLT